MKFLKVKFYHCDTTANWLQYETQFIFLLSTLNYLVSHLDILLKLVHEFSYECNRKENWWLYENWLIIGLLKKSFSRPLTAEGRIRSQVSSCEFVLDKMAVGEVFLQVLRFSPVIITLPVFHAHICLQIALTRRTNVRNLGIFKTIMAFRKSGSFRWKSTSNFLLFSWLNCCVFQFYDMYKFSGDASIILISILKNYESFSDWKKIT